MKTNNTKWIIAGLTAMLLLTGCSANRIGENDHSTDNAANAASDTSAANAATGAAAGGSNDAAEPQASAPKTTPESKLTVPVQASNLSLTLPEGWTPEGSGDSFAFKAGGKPAGGLEGLGYSDSIDGLLPNGAVVDKQEELKGLPVRTVRAALTLEGRANEGKRKEVHYFFFLKDLAVVYDLRFDPDVVSEEQARLVVESCALHEN